MYMNVLSACVYVHTPHVCSARQSQKLLNLLKLGLQLAMKHCVRTNSEFSTREASAFNY